MHADKWWINKNALLLSLSAFFADLGYQVILAGFPVFLVIMLHAPVYLLGILYAITYGGGAIAGYLGGVFGDRLGRKKVSIFGNAFILLLSSIGFAGNAVQSVVLFATGWWSRDLRTPPRRAMLGEATSKSERGRAFGLLHLFDIGGGAIAVSYLIFLLYLRLRIQTIFLATALPLSISTICLLFVTVGRKGKSREKAGPESNITKRSALGTGTLKGILVATALFGFSFYSLGFPILTISQASGNSILGILSYLVYLLFSAVAGYIIGLNARRINMVRGLAFFGYLLAAIAALLLSASYALHLGLGVMYLAVALIGIALGSIETLEPTIITFISSDSEMSRKLGYLTSSRSIGLFVANLSMGVLYAVDPAYSYLYAAFVSLAAAAILLQFGRGFRANG